MIATKLVLALLKQEHPEVLSLLGKSSLLNGGAIPLAMGWALSCGLLRARLLGPRLWWESVVCHVGL